MPERRDEGFAAAEFSQREFRGIAQMRIVFRTEVGHAVSFPVSPEIFDGIEFGSVCRESFEMNVLLGGVIAHGTTPMRAESVPDDEQVAANVALEVGQKPDHLFALDRSRMELKVEVPPGHPRDRREGFPGETMLEDGRLPARGPGADAVRSFRESTFVDEDDRSPFVLGFFLMRGQSTRFHRRIAASSRSIARPVGRWQLQPRDPRIFQT